MNIQFGYMNNSLQNMSESIYWHNVGEVTARVIPLRERFSGLCEVCLL